MLLSVSSDGIEDISRRASTTGAANKVPQKGAYGKVFLAPVLSPNHGLAVKIQREAEDPDDVVKRGGPGSLEYEAELFKELIEVDPVAARSIVNGGVLAECRYDDCLDSNDVYTVGRSRSTKASTFALCMPMMHTQLTKLGPYLTAHMRSEESRLDDMPNIDLDKARESETVIARANAVFAIRLIAFKALKIKLRAMHGLGYVHGDMKTDNVMTSKPYLGETHGSSGIELIRMVEDLTLALQAGEVDSEGAKEAIAVVCDHFQSLRLIDLGLSQRIGDNCLRYDCETLGNKHPGISDKFYRKLKLRNDRDSELDPHRKEAQLRGIGRAHPYMDFISLVGIGLELLKNAKWSQLSDSYNVQDIDWQCSWLATVKKLVSQARVSGSHAEKLSQFKQTLCREVEEVACQVFADYNALLIDITRELVDLESSEVHDHSSSSSKLPTRLGKRSWGCLAS